MGSQAQETVSTSTMAEDNEDLTPVDVEKDEEEGYQPPPEKSIDDMLQADQVDESDPRKVIVKYLQKTHKMTIPVDKMTHMVGSYAPKDDVHSYLTPAEDAPSGMIKRGTYNIHSLFTDDDKNEHLKWEWNLEIRKDWA